MNTSNPTAECKEPTASSTSTPETNDLLPTIPTSAPTTHHLKSNLLLFTTLAFLFLILILSSALSINVPSLAFLTSTSLSSSAPTPLTLPPPQSYSSTLPGILLLVAGVATAIWWTQIHKVDWWKLGVGYWRVCVPVFRVAGLVLVMAQEGETGLGEVD